MTNIIDSELFLDSCIWIEYFLNKTKETKEIVERERSIIFTSIISIHEIFKKFLKLNKTEKEALEAIKFVEDNSIIIYLDKEIALNAVIAYKKYKLHTIDSLIYSSATTKTKAVFVTADKDFHKTPNTKLIEIK
ncbi:PIN domain-containing protein [Candidatus Micrarchaeota archaeon]|nr:PIN domain-containing protein [Candidatus Micrarchaeota archaeon]MBU2476754.1 PIN domain-containing protein [Candidatus Micrarchaeota archaeon]